MLKYIHIDQGNKKKQKQKQNQKQNKEKRSKKSIRLGLNFELIFTNKHIFSCPWRQMSRSLRIKLKHFSNRPSSVVLEYMNFNLLLF